MTEQRKAVIKNADMTEEMQQDAVDIASQALAKYNIEKVRKQETWFVIWSSFQLPVESILCADLSSLLHFFLQDVAAYIKKEFDKKHNPTWWVWDRILVIVFAFPDVKRV